MSLTYFHSPCGRYFATYAVHFIKILLVLEKLLHFKPLGMDHLDHANDYSKRTDIEDRRTDQRQG